MGQTRGAADDGVDSGADNNSDAVENELDWAEDRFKRCSARWPELNFDSLSRTHLLSASACIIAYRSKVLPGRVECMPFRVDNILDRCWLSRRP